MKMIRDACVKSVMNDIEFPQDIKEWLKNVYRPTKGGLSNDFYVMKKLCPIYKIQVQNESNRKFDGINYVKNSNYYGEHLETPCMAKDHPQSWSSDTDFAVVMRGFCVRHHPQDDIDVPKDIAVLNWTEWDRCGSGKFKTICGKVKMNESQWATFMNVKKFWRQGGYPIKREIATKNWFRYQLYDRHEGQGWRNGFGISNSNLSDKQKVWIREVMNLDKLSMDDIMRMSQVRKFDFKRDVEDHLVLDYWSRNEISSIH